MIAPGLSARALKLRVRLFADIASDGQSSPQWQEDCANGRQ
jgi:hypothetical protein